jgi:hypothetical protein
MERPLAARRIRIGAGAETIRVRLRHEAKQATVRGAGKRRLCPVGPGGHVPALRRSPRHGRGERIESEDLDEQTLCGTDVRQQDQTDPRQPP